MLEWALNSIFDLLFPRYCFECQKTLTCSETLFCESCRRRLPLLSPGCPVCASPGYPHRLCKRCLAGRAFDQVVVPFRYEGPLAKAIKTFKYQGRLWLARELVRLWKRYLCLPDHDLLLPVPLHRSRLLERGFNQSLLLARFMSPQKTVPDLLQRIRPTHPQTTLSEKGRWENVRRAFSLKEPGVVRNRSILLVDDVMTTGATVEECARVLREAGATKIVVALLARAS